MRMALHPASAMGLALALVAPGLALGAPSAVMVTSGHGVSVDGAWSWSTIPAWDLVNVAEPGLAPSVPRPSEQRISYDYSSWSDGTESFNYNLDLGAGALMNCDRTRSGPSPGSPPIGSGKLVIQGQILSEGTCTLDHPWVPGLVPQTVEVSFEGNFSSDSCTDGSTPPILFVPSVPLAPVPPCDVSLAGNHADIQAWRGVGAFVAINVVPNSTLPAVSSASGSVVPWRGAWSWTHAALDVPAVNDAATMTFAFDVRADGNGTDFEWSVEIEHVSTADTGPSKLRFDCYHDAHAGSEGIAFLHTEAEPGVLGMGPCKLGPLGLPRPSARANLLPGACAVRFGGFLCQLTTLSPDGDVAGDGGFTPVGATDSAWTWHPTFLTGPGGGT